MTKVLAMLLIALVVEAIGVVLLNRGLKQIGEVQHVSAGEIAWIVRRGLTSADLLLGVALETAFLGRSSMGFRSGTSA